LDLGEKKKDYRRATFKTLGSGKNICAENLDITGNATTATMAEATFTNDIGGDSHASALKGYFDNNKATTPRNKLLSFYSGAYSNGSQCMGYFLNGYDNNPYGGFFVAHYDSPKYVGINDGAYTEWELSKVGHDHDKTYLKLDGGGTLAGSPVIKFPAAAGTIAAGDPMAITYGRISAHGPLRINADSDGTKTEYLILTSGWGLSDSTAHGLAIGYSSLTW
jgi:hypothetical protein